MKYVYIAFDGSIGDAPIMAIFDTFDAAEAYCEAEGYTLVTWTVAKGFKLVKSTTFTFE